MRGGEERKLQRASTAHGGNSTHSDPSIYQMKSQVGSFWVVAAHLFRNPWTKRTSTSYCSSLFPQKFSLDCLPRPANLPLAPPNALFALGLKGVEGRDDPKAQKRPWPHERNAPNANSTGFTKQHGAVRCYALVHVRE